MRFEKLKDSRLLKPGELLVVLKILCFSNCNRVPKAGVYNFTEIVRSQFRGLPGRSMPEYSGDRKRRMSGEPTSATRRQKKSSYLTASPSNSGKDEIRTGYPTPTTIYLSGISEAGKSIVESSERTEAASTAKSTALPSGIGKIGRALPHHALR
jgi:hypothetical protein